MDMTRLNPLVYTDVHPLDDYEPDGTTAAVADDVDAQRRALAAQERKKMELREWKRIKQHLISPKQREVAMTRMAKTPHDFNLIIYSEEKLSEAAGDTDLPWRERLGKRRAADPLAQYLKPDMINLVVEEGRLWETSGGGIVRDKEGKTYLSRPNRESIYTAHTILHRVGDDEVWRSEFNRDWWGWRMFKPEYMKAYSGKPYKEALIEGVMRAAGLYLSRPDQSLFRRRTSRRGFKRAAPLRERRIEEAGARIDESLSLPVALLATDPKIVRTLAESMRARFKSTFGMMLEQRAYAEDWRGREKTSAPVEGPLAILPWEEQRQRFIRDMGVTLYRIREALIYGSGTTWISRQGIAADVSQVMAETMPQTEMYGGTKFLVPEVIGRMYAEGDIVRGRVPTKDVPIPPDIREEVQAVMRPVELAFDAYNNAVLDSLVGQKTRI
jgi:hypothetical protein